MFPRGFFPISWFDPQWWPGAPSSVPGHGSRVGGRHVAEMIFAFRAARQERDRLLRRRALARIEAEEATELAVLLS